MTRELDRARSRHLGGAVADAHILVTTGAGGVGKTTTAAALGLAGATAGRRTLVLTIDPARRLAQAMGLSGLDNDPRRVALPDEVAGGGELWAMMLDMQSTFDALIDRHASSRRHAEAIRSNRIYATLSSSLSGTHEYMAMERLHELHDDGTWDLLVVDTPPTRSALDFLDAPNRMTSFLEGRLLRLFLAPTLAAGRGYLRAVNAGATAFMRVAGKVTGMELLSDLADFFRNFEGMYEGFKARATEVLHLLQRPTSRFVIVTSPQPPPLREAKFFLERLEQEGLHDAGVVVNRVHPTLDSAPSPQRLRDAVRSGRVAGADPATLGVLSLLADVSGLAAREHQHVDAALFGTRPQALVEVPLLRSDIHDLGGLGTIARRLTGDDARREDAP